MKKIYMLSLITFFTLNSLAFAQECRTDIDKTAPDSRYELLNDGKEVRDKKTGLIWQRCSLGQIWDGKLVPIVQLLIHGSRH